MAHNIHQDATGKDCMFMVGKREDAWHLLGKRCERAQTAAEAMQLSGLDWDVIKVQNYSRCPIEKFRADLNKLSNVVPVSSYTIFRSTDGADLGTVGEGFTIKQNRDCFQFVDDLLQAPGGAHYDSAGALGNGATIWCSVRVPSADFTVAGEDTHQTYLTFTTAHDGSMAHTAFLTMVRTVCQNTLRAGLSANTGILRIKHTKNADQRFLDAKRTMEGVVMDAGKLRDKLALLAQRKMTRESLTSIMDRLFPKPEDEKANTTRRDNILADVMALYESNDKNAVSSIRGTAYNLLNAVTEYADHYRTARVTDNKPGYTVAMARAESAVIGTGNALKQSALDVILEQTASNPAHMVNYSIARGDIGQTGGGLLADVLANHE